MSIPLIIAIVVLAAFLFTYMWLEKRIGQRRCAACGFGVSLDSPDPDCPRCNGRLDRGDAVRGWSLWASLLIPLLIIGLDAVVLLHERGQTDGQKALRLVGESRSRKENFTIQQYLYSTVYHRRDRGEDVRIEGWRAGESDSRGVIRVEFSYFEAGVPRVAAWEVDLPLQTATPQNEIAGEMSWN